MHTIYNHGQKSWDTLVFSYTEVHKGNKTPNCDFPSHVYFNWYCGPVIKLKCSIFVDKLQVK